jgi:hypothetical protein
MNNGRVIAEEGESEIWVFLVVVVAAIIFTMGLMWAFYPEFEEPAEQEDRAVIEWDQAVILAPETSLATLIVENPSSSAEGAEYYIEGEKVEAYQLIIQLRGQIREMQEIMEVQFGLEPIN